MNVFVIVLCSHATSQRDSFWPKLYLDPPSTFYIPKIGTIYPYSKGTRRVLVEGASKRLVFKLSPAPNWHSTGLLLRNLNQISIMVIYSD